MSDPTIIGGLIEKIRTGETKAEKEMLELACAYRELKEETGSAKKAAALAKAEGLRYSATNTLNKLIAWGELVEAINGGVSGRLPPFTEWQIRPLLAKHFQDQVSPGELAEIWNGLEEQTPQAFVTAAREAYPQPKKEPDQQAKFLKAVRAAQDTEGGWKAATDVPALFQALGPPNDHLTLYIAEAIAAKWGSLTKFNEQASQVRKKNVKDRAAVSDALKQGGLIQ